MSARLLGFGFFVVAVVIFMFNDGNKMAQFATCCCLLFGSACMVKFRPPHVPKKDKSVFITGCDTGFGHSLAIALDKLGCRVYAGCYILGGDGERKLKETCSDKLFTVALDVTSDKSVADAVKFIKNQGHELWGLVNNAGLNYLGDAELTPMSQYNRISSVNTFGMIRVALAAIPLLRKQQGRIINVTSLKGRCYLPLAAAYCVSKYGIEAFSNILRIEMERWGIKVSIIEPCNFGSTTGMHDMKVIQKDYQEIWENMDEERKLLYGKEYLDSQVDGCRAGLQEGAKSVQPVTDAFIDALFSEEPDHHYLIGGSSHSLYDLCKVAAYATMYLPVRWADKLLKRWYFNIQLPKSLQKKNE